MREKNDPCLIISHHIQKLTWNGPRNKMWKKNFFPEENRVSSHLRVENNSLISTQKQYTSNLRTNLSKYTRKRMKNPRGREDISNTNIQQKA